MTQMYFVSCSFIVVYIPWHFRACNQIRISNDAWTRILIKVNSNGWNIKSSDSARLYTRKQDVLMEDLKLKLFLKIFFLYAPQCHGVCQPSSVYFMQTSFDVCIYISCTNRCPRVHVCTKYAYCIYGVHWKHSAFCRKPKLEQGRERLEHTLIKKDRD